MHIEESLYMGYSDVEKLLAHSAKLIRSSNIQTNDTITDDRFAELLKKYKTHVETNKWVT